MKWWEGILLGIALGLVGAWLFFTHRNDQLVHDYHDSLTVVKTQHTIDSTRSVARMLADSQNQRDLAALRDSMKASHAAGDQLAQAHTQLTAAEEKAKAAIAAATTIDGKLAATTTALTAADARADGAEGQVVNMATQRDQALRSLAIAKASGDSLRKDANDWHASSDRFQRLAEKGDTIMARQPPKLFLGIFGKPKPALGLGATAGYGVTVASDGSVHGGKSVAVGITAGLVVPIGN